MSVTESRSAVYCVLLFLSMGCAPSYVTPGGSVKLTALGDADINQLMATPPAAQFPANLAVARVQASGYRSHANESYGAGRYSIVTTRDVEKDEDLERLGAMPMVQGVAAINRLLLPAQLDSIKALRSAAARLRTDILLIYTFDTSFRVGTQSLGPLNLIFLGMLPNREVNVSTTASAALFDVRSEFLYGLAEASARDSQYASVWNSSSAIDDLRLATETKAFQSLIREVEKTWSGILRQHAAGYREMHRPGFVPGYGPAEGPRYETMAGPES
jgi:hypothetical protein